MTLLLTHIVDRFIPARIRRDRDEWHRGRLLIGLLLLLGVPMPVFLLAHLVRGDVPMAVITAGAVLFEVVIIGAYMATGARRLLTQLLLVSGSLAIVYVSSTTGGLTSPVTPILAVLPLLSFVLVSPRWGLAWGGVALVQIGAISVLESSGWLPDGSEGFQAQPVVAALNFALLMGYALGIVAFLHNLERLRLADVLEARERAEEASRAKSAFLANMSHELRTPMNGVLGLVEALLAEGGLSPKQRTTLRTVRGSGRSLVALLNDLLDLSRVEAGKLELEQVAVHPATIAHDVVALLGKRSDERRVRLSVQADEDVGWGLGDPARLRQVLLNLVGNAVKFTEDGQVTVRVCRERDTVVIAIEDTGIGISAEQLEHLFEPFVQADASTTRRFGGSGLGLTISRRLVDVMGGELAVQSAVGQGSTFTVRVPLEPCEAPVRIEEASIGGGLEPGLTVLVAEDNPVNQLVVRRLLENLGVQVRLVADGEQALDAVDEEPPAVILMDIHMPRMDGLEATRLLRARGLELPIIALTASALPEDRDEARAAGMCDFLVKPVDPCSLEKALVRAQEAAMACTCERSVG